MIEIQSFLITTAFTEDCADILNKLLIPGYFVVYFLLEYLIFVTKVSTLNGRQMLSVPF